MNHARKKWGGREGDMGWHYWEGESKANPTLSSFLLRPFAWFMASFIFLLLRAHKRAFKRGTWGKMPFSLGGGALILSPKAHFWLSECGANSKNLSINYLLIQLLLLARKFWCRWRASWILCLKWLWFIHTVRQLNWINCLHSALEYQACSTLAFPQSFALRLLTVLFFLPFRTAPEHNIVPIPVWINILLTSIISAPWTEKEQTLFKDLRNRQDYLIRGICEEK